MRKLLWSCLPLILVAAAGGCGAPKEETVEQREIRRATAWINPASDSEVVGSAIFIKEGDRITLQVSVENAPPGNHGCHIHEIGDCSADGTSAGGHWNPTGEDHGRWGATPFHLGDVGNVVVGDNGKGTLVLSTDLWSMGTGEPNDVMGKAVIIHADADDFESQPTGAAGGRIGCGVIKEG